MELFLSLFNPLITLVTKLFPKRSKPVILKIEKCSIFIAILAKSVADVFWAEKVYFEMMLDNKKELPSSILSIDLEYSGKFAKLKYEPPLPIVIEQGKVVKIISDGYFNKRTDYSVSRQQIVSELFPYQNSIQAKIIVKFNNSKEISWETSFPIERKSGIHMYQKEKI